MALSPDMSINNDDGSGSRSKFKYSDGLPSKFDPKKLVCQLDQKLKKIQMIGEGVEEANKQAKKFKESIRSIDKKRDDWRHLAKVGTKSYGSVNRDTRKNTMMNNNKRSDAASPDYNIYSDSDRAASETEQSAQKEGGSPEQSNESRVQSNSTAVTVCTTGGIVGGNRPRQSISANRLA